MRALNIIATLLLLTACGQEDAVFPEPGTASGGQCGAFYPGGENTDSDADTASETESPYGMEEGKLFPCAVWESARLAGKNTYINIGEEYLAAKHGKSSRKFVVVVVSAEGCSQCALLIRQMTERTDEFDDAGALMIGMARSVLGGDGPDLTLDEAAQTLAGERWPMDRWYVINDQEYYFNESFEANNPWVVVVSLADMKIVRLGNDDFPASSQGVSDLLAILGG